MLKDKMPASSIYPYMQALEKSDEYPLQTPEDAKIPNVLLRICCGGTWEKRRERHVGVVNRIRDAGDEMVAGI